MAQFMGVKKRKTVKLQKKLHRERLKQEKWCGIVRGAQHGTETWKTRMLVERSRFKLSGAVANVSAASTHGIK